MGFKYTEYTQFVESITQNTISQDQTRFCWRDRSDYTYKTTNDHTHDTSTQINKPSS